MRRPAYLIFAISALWLWCLPPADAAPTPSNSAARAAKLCHTLIGQAEQELNIPRHLLQAVALTESGRTISMPPSGAAQDAEDRETFTAWPWTVMAEGRGRYLPSKEAAIREVRMLRQKGVTNIDVGCMQVNLHYHGDAFSSLEEAFDPIHNVAYAATLLSKLREDRHSWTMAVKFYHSSDRERQSYYRKKVFTAWRKLQKRARGERLAANSNKAPGWAANPARAPLFRNYAAQKRQEETVRARLMSQATQ
ncbi:transglycosylase SLT domain-containing protein [Aestuariispira ectoiniformans]|uniref:transglycosylase SLT domain-containing protein n=1 Tax=Aestuariispira ectoiniformans TaxID=2775080 RepID=UPI00223AA6E4|nr:transglycosylase SLT domain-containing protein [Aestuariispira ectoiniformans]